MNPLTKIGDIHGCNYTHSPSVKSHLRPLDNHTRTRSVINHVRVDNVESNVGTGFNTSHIRSILLPYRKHQGKD
jgi:hypothetical protein